jgi:hypothetical protein
MHLIAHRDELLILLKQIHIPVNVHEDRRRARARGRGRLFALCGGLEQIYPGNCVQPPVRRGSERGSFQFSDRFQPQITPGRLMDRLGHHFRLVRVMMLFQILR